MRAVITPAATKPSKSPRIKILERIVFRTARPQMELVIHGNRAGYRPEVPCENGRSGQSSLMRR